MSNKLPSVRAALQKQQKESIERAKARARGQDVRVRKALDVVLRTEHGRTVMAYLFGICGYNEKSYTLDAQGGIQTGNLLYNDARRGVYADLRKKGSFDLVKAAEDLAEREQFELVEQ